MRSRLAAAFAIGCLGACLCACAREPEPGPGKPPAYALRDVVRARIAELEARLSAPPPPADDADPELEERVAGLVHQATQAEERWRALAREEVASLGDAALPALVRAFDAAPDDDAQRGAAIALVGALAAASDSARASAPLLEWVDRGRPAWVRAHAAHQLGQLGQDRVVPGLVRRLMYETDGETVIWLADALARYAVFAGLDGLFTLERSAATPELRALASQTAARLAAEAGFQDAAALWRAWSTSGAEGLPRAEPSPELRLAVWRLVDGLSGANFQLRGVDEARFVLSRLPEWAVEPLSEALHERDAYTRLHAAQCLERMGARARNAAPALIALLALPESAGAAAAALGAIGDPAALAPLTAALAPSEPYDLRVAAARALGVLDDPGAIAPLRVLLAPSEPFDLRQTAAAALAALGEREGVLPFLLECLGSDQGDRAGAEHALEAWLARESEGSDAAREVLERWRALGEGVDHALNVSSDRERQAARHALLAERLDELVTRE